MEENQQRDNLLSNGIVRFLLVVQKCGGHWFGHLPIVKQFLLKLEDFFNNYGLPASAYRRVWARVIHWTFGHTIFYLDFINGDNAEDGSTWALAWKTVTGGPTAARITAGDVIRMAKSPDPVSLGNVTFTNASATLTLAAAKTLELDDCDSAWTASANVVQSSDSSYVQEGTYSRKFAVASGFTTGKIAYRDSLGAQVDFSGYEKISFWIKVTTTVAADVLQIKLCSDDAGNVPVETFTIDKPVYASSWHCVTIDKGSALSATIRSVALYAASDPGTTNIYLDNIFAANDLHLQSVIGKNTDGEHFWKIKSIVDTTVVLGAFGENHAYYGTTETVTGYARECLVPTSFASGSATENNVQEGGTVGNLITFSGGWDVSTTEQNGETWYMSMGESNGIGFRIRDLDYVRLERFYGVSGYEGVYAVNVNYSEFDDIGGIGTSAEGVIFKTKQCVFTNDLIGSQCQYYGVEFMNDGQNIINRIIANTNFYGNVYFSTSFENVIGSIYARGCNPEWNQDAGIVFAPGGGNIILGGELKDNRYGVYQQASFRNLLVDVEMNNSVYDIYILEGNVHLKNCKLDGTAEAYFSDYSNDHYVGSQKHDQGTGHKIIFKHGTIESETTVRHTASGVAWKMTPTYAAYKLRLHPENFKVAVKSGSEVTITVYVRKDGSYNGDAPRLVLVGGIVAGVASNVTDTLSVGADTWEQLSVSGTPTEDGVLEFYVDCNGIAGNIYVDDVAVSQ